MNESQFPSDVCVSKTQQPQDMPSNSGFPGGLTTELLSLQVYKV